MQVFTDKKGRNWTVVINVAAVHRVKAMLDIDLMCAVEGGLMKKLSAVALLGNLLFVLCEKEALARGVTDRKFGAALGGGCMVAAYSAFLTELVSFFPKGDKKEKTDDRRPTTDDHSPTCTAEDCWGLVWSHAGVLGIDPGIFTLRELSLMAKSRKKESWHRISAVLAQNHNMNRTSNADPVRSPDDYNPYAEHKEETRIVDTKLAFSIMKEIWRGK